MNYKHSPRRGPATDNVAKLTIKEDGTLLAATRPQTHKTQVDATPQPVGNQRGAIQTV